jgi:ATP-dependent DNA helicase PIF1
MGKKRAYVVTKGRQTGIFSTWDEVEPLVKKFKGAKYQGYSSRDDAEQAWRANQAAAPSFATAEGVPAAPAFVPASSCVFFAQGRCRNGAACPFSHDGERPICVFYNTTGCNNGAACPFRHEGRPASAPAFVPAPPAPAPTPSIRDMKAAILQAGLGVADLVEKSDVVERYRQALAAARPAAPAFVPRGAASSPPEDPVAAAARAAAVPVRPSNPRPMRGSVTTPTRPDDDGADARHELTEEQESVCAAALRGESLFFTGNAGTGKTTTMRELITRLTERGSGKVFVTASTGAAAVLCRGTTLHSFAGIGLGKESAERLIMKLSKAARKRWGQASTLVIDEISMIDGTLLDKIDAVGRAARRSSRPFGGVQVIVSGDFMQLPPVKVSRFAFEADVWSTAFGANQFCLTRVFRQHDQSFVSLLNELRVGRASPATCATLQATVARGLGAVDGIEPTKLFARNVQVDAINKQRLLELAGATTTLRARDEGDVRRIEQCSYPAELHLKRNAQIMLLKNIDVEKKLINGSRGRVVAIQRKDGQIDSIKCQFKNAGEWNVKRDEATVEEAGKVLASRSQFPLRLAWALSIHKSQGQTIDLLDCDLQGCFEDGQAYTAVSRASDLDNLVVRNFSPRVVKASAKCLAFDQRLRRGDAAPADDDDVVDLTADAPPAPASGGWNYADGRRPPPNRAATLPTGSANCLAGKVFVTTGVLPTLDRDQIKAIATKCGGRCTTAVSSKTTHLIAGDVLDDGRPVAESGKYKKAATLGTAIISEAEFRAMIR